MFVKIIIYADNKRYSALMIAGSYKKRVYDVLNTGSAVETLLIGLIDCLKKIKYPIELEIISDSQILSDILDQGLENFKNKDYVNKNIKLWNELGGLLRQQCNYSFTYNNSREKDDKIFKSLYRDCLYKRF